MEGLRKVVRAEGNKEREKPKLFDALTIVFLLLILVIFILSVIIPSPVYSLLLSLVTGLIMTRNALFFRRSRKKWAAVNAAAAIFIFFLVLYQFLLL